MRLRPTTILTQEWRNHFIWFDSVGHFFTTFGEGTQDLFTAWLVERPRSAKRFATFFLVFGFIYMFYGFFSNFKKDHYELNSMKTIPLILFVEFIIFGALKKYPFTVPRTSLFFAPVVLLMTIQGIDALKGIHRGLHRAICSLYFIFLVYLTIHFSYWALTGQALSQPVY